MAFHHVALATRDTAATHRFYTEVMGFELVKVVGLPGWVNHIAFDAATIEELYETATAGEATA